MPHDVSIQDRLEYHDKFDVSIFENSVITGVDFKYLGMTSYQDYQTEPVAYYDLSQPANQILYPGYAYQGNTWGGGLQVPGTTGYSAGPPLSNISNVVETEYDTALLLPGRHQADKKLTLTAGYRIDNIAVHGESPPVIEEGYYNSFFTYVPLASPVYIPEGGSTSTVPGYNNSRTVNDQSFFVSLTYKPNEGLDALRHATTTSTASSGQSNFGGIDAVYLTRLAAAQRARSTRPATSRVS